jgi:hypothetical protein
MEPNPYEPPHEKGPLTTGKMAKRGLGVGGIILLTPVAVGIALIPSCAAAYALLEVATISRINTYVLLYVGLAVFAVPPTIALKLMIDWAIRTHRRNKPPSNT